ncbi:MAG TPA: Crp/Fnr family transcriptional regulator [Casimicrobiaceae bacterium]|nr:Crp/Fnr family transcriptional regulator [Casimicrobiaceae bacterium]
MRETALAMLLHHPFVAEFEPRHVEKLAGLARQIRFERDQVVFREGDDCSEFYLIVTGLVALEIVAPGHTFRVQTLFAGDELGWSALLMGRGKNFQARTLERVDALAFEGTELLAACREDTLFGFMLMQRLLAVVAERLQATRVQLLDMYSPIAARAGA